MIAESKKSLPLHPKTHTMCQTEIISQHIGAIGRRSFDKRMQLASPSYVEKRGTTARLLNEVDHLCEQLHNDFPTITADDYRMFEAKLKILINTLELLWQESLSHPELAPYSQRLSLQIADLQELDHDIKTFRVNAERNTALKATMATIGKLDFSKFSQN